MPDPAQAAEMRRRARELVAGFYPSTAYPSAPWHGSRAADDYGLPASPDWRGVDWPSHVRRTEVSGDEVVYVDLGAGSEPPVVFVHGLAGMWQDWLENLPRAAQQRRAIALDLPGFGQSPMPSEKISISGYAALVDGLLEQLGIESAVVVGNSMGGFVSSELAIKFPARVDRLVLVSAAGISATHLRRRTTLTGARVAGVISAATLARRETVVARPRLRHLAMSFVIRHPSRMRPDLLLEVAPGSNAPGFMDAFDALLGYDFRDRLGEIACPTLIVWGREDMLVPVNDADEFERRIPNARKVIFDETGHVAMLERPRSFNDCLMRFVAEGAEVEGPGAANRGVEAEGSEPGAAEGEPPAPALTP